MNCSSPQKKKQRQSSDNLIQLLSFPDEIITHIFRFLFVPETISDSVEKIPTNFQDLLSFAVTNTKFFLLYKQFLHQTNLNYSNLVRFRPVCCKLCSKGIIPFHFERQLYLCHSQLRHLQVSEKFCVHLLNNVSNTLSTSLTLLTFLDMSNAIESTKKTYDNFDLSHSIAKLKRLLNVDASKPCKSLFSGLSTLLFLKHISLNDVQEDVREDIVKFLKAATCSLQMVSVLFRDDQQNLSTSSKSSVELSILKDNVLSSGRSCFKNNYPLGRSINLLSYQLVKRTTVRGFVLYDTVKSIDSATSVYDHDQFLVTITNGSSTVRKASLFGDSYYMHLLVHGCVHFKSSANLCQPKILDNARIFMTGYRAFGRIRKHDTPFKIEYGDKAGNDKIFEASLVDIVFQDKNTPRNENILSSSIAHCVHQLDISNLGSGYVSPSLNYLLESEPARDSMLSFLNRCSPTISVIKACHPYNFNDPSVVTRKLELSLQLAVDIATRAPNIKTAILNVDFLISLHTKTKYRKHSLLGSFFQNLNNLEYLYLEDIITTIGTCIPPHAMESSSAQNRKTMHCFRSGQESWEDFLIILPLVLRHIRTFCKSLRSFTINGKDLYINKCSARERESKKLLKKAENGEGVMYVKSYIANLSESWRSLRNLEQALPKVNVETVEKQLHAIQDAVPKLLGQT